jgi:hypothetical protein
MTKSSVQVISRILSWMMLMPWLLLKKCSSSKMDSRQSSRTSSRRSSRHVQAKRQLVLHRMVLLLMQMRLKNSRQQQ